MKCPTCKKEVLLGDPNLPFCSARCQLLDLGAWAAEKYVISTPISHVPQPSEEQDEQ